MSLFERISAALKTFRETGAQGESTVVVQTTSDGRLTTNPVSVMETKEVQDHLQQIRVHRAQLITPSNTSPQGR
jgi:hypothetical protein